MWKRFGFNKIKKLYEIACGNNMKSLLKNFFYWEDKECWNFIYIFEKLNLTTMKEK